MERESNVVADAVTAKGRVRAQGLGFALQHGPVCDVLGELIQLC